MSATPAASGVRGLGPFKAKGAHPGPLVGSQRKAWEKRGVGLPQTKKNVWLRWGYRRRS